MDIDWQLITSLTWWQWILIYCGVMYVLGIALLRHEYRTTNLSEGDAIGIWIFSPLIMPFALVLTLIMWGGRKEKK